MLGELIHTARRYSSLMTHRISALPIAILMPHSACNCRCVMCDIWKGNRNLRQLTEKDVTGILVSLEKLGTRRVLMSGGEPLLNPNFFSFCEMIRARGMKITLLSTGMTVERHAADIVKHTDDLIVSLDGDEATHNAIRNIPAAFQALKRGVGAIRKIDPSYPVTGRCVIHRLNYRAWPRIIDAAKAIDLLRISFLPADVTSEAFNRTQPWNPERRESVLVPKEELGELSRMTETVISEYKSEFANGFIVESPSKFRKILQYYQAHWGLAEFPEKKCNAPWVSAVVEADGTVLPCFFHDKLGSVHDDALHNVLNSEAAIMYRRKLNVAKNETCRKCVCSLNLPATSAHY
jgi:Fe-coproporphyrin III synthase